MVILPVVPKPGAVSSSFPSFRGCAGFLLEHTMKKNHRILTRRRSTDVFNHHLKTWVHQSWEILPVHHADASGNLKKDIGLNPKTTMEKQSAVESVGIPGRCHQKKAGT